MSAVEGDCFYQSISMFDVHCGVVLVRVVRQGVLSSWGLLVLYGYILYTIVSSLLRIVVMK